LLINFEALGKQFSYLLAIFVFIVVNTNAQSLRQPVSAVYLGLGAYSTQHTDVFSFVNNQAALAQVRDAAVGLYGERRFLLSETSVYSAAIGIPSRMGNFGVSLKYMGFKNYNENQIGLAYARRLGKKVDIGVQFNYYGYKVPGYTSDNAVDFEIGALVHLSDKITAGIHVYNPVGGEFTKTDEKLTAAYKFGLGYDASDRFFVSAELVKEENFPVNLNAGVQYQFAKQFFARAGVASVTSTSYAGVGVAWDNFRLDVSGSYHPQLGLSPGLLLIISFGKKETETTLPAQQ
jgi:hypothetical protein